MSRRKPTGKPNIPGRLDPPKDTRIKPGQALNPKGSSKVAHLKKVFKDYVTTLDKQEVYEIAKRNAKRGIPFFVELFLDRTEGKVPQAVKVGGDEGNPVIVNFQVISKEAAENSEKLRKMFKSGS